MHSSVDGDLGCFCTLVMVNNAALSIGGHASFLICVLLSFRQKPRTGIAASCDSSSFKFLRKPHTVFRVISAPLFEETVFSLLYILGSFVVDQLTT